MSIGRDRTRALLVLEQTLGNAVYGAMVEHAARTHPAIDPAVVRVDYEQSQRLVQLPLARNWSLRSSLTARAGVAEVTRQRSPDVMFVHTQVPALLLGRAMRHVPTVLSTDATPLAFDAVAASYGHTTQPAAVESVKTRLVGRVFRRAVAVVAWSEWTEQSLVSVYDVDPRRIHRIPPGVDLATFHPSPDRRREGPMRVLFVGGDYVRKGGPELVAASQALAGRVELHIVTPQPPDALPAGVVVHAGLRPRSTELADVFRHCDVLALPTRGDAHPHVVVEAMASGLPVIATRVGAIPELVPDGERGILVDPGDAPALTAALLRLATDSPLRHELGWSAARYAVEQHDARTNLSTLMALLRECAGAGAVGHPDRPKGYPVRPLPRQASAAAAGGDAR